jgi:hypothetical protein
MAPTLDQMTTALTARLDGPHTDEDTAAAARLMAEAVRFLNRATAGGTGLSYPATPYTVTGELASAAARLDQLTEQLGRFLARELAAGRLGDDFGSDPADAVARADDYLASAAAAAVALTDALGAAQNCLTSLYQTDDCTADAGRTRRTERRDERDPGAGWSRGVDVPRPARIGARVPPAGPRRGWRRRPGGQRRAVRVRAGHQRLSALSLWPARRHGDRVFRGAAGLRRVAHRSTRRRRPRPRRLSRCWPARRGRVWLRAGHRCVRGR